MQERESIVAQQYYIKKKIGDDVQKKIRHVQDLAMSAGYTSAQIRLLLGLIDHESAGTWDEKVVGDGGCSIGIAQWNKCAGNIAPTTFEEQAKDVVQRMKAKFEAHSDDIAIGKWNAPAWSSNPAYVKEVRESSLLFIEER